MKICFCFLLAIIDPLPLFSPASQSDSSEIGRTILGAETNEGYWSIITPLWVLIRILLGCISFYAALNFDSTVSPNTKAFQLAVEARVTGEHCFISFFLFFFFPLFSFFEIN